MLIFFIEYEHFFLFISFLFLFFTHMIINIFIEKREEKERLFYVEKNVIIAKIAKVLHAFL